MVAAEVNIGGVAAKGKQGLKQILLLHLKYSKSTLEVLQSSALQTHINSCTLRAQIKANTFASQLRQATIDSSIAILRGGFLGCRFGDVKKGAAVLGSDADAISAPASKKWSTPSIELLNTAVKLGVLFALILFEIVFAGNCTLRLIEIGKTWNACPSQRTSLDLIQKAIVEFWPHPLEGESQALGLAPGHLFSYSGNLSQNGYGLLHAIQTLLQRAFFERVLLPK
eukprot:5420826-Amphidinium_carterae.1